jgi:hypothetical protein
MKRKFKPVSVAIAGLIGTAHVAACYYENSTSVCVSQNDVVGFYSVGSCQVLVRAATDWWGWDVYDTGSEETGYYYTYDVPCQGLAYYTCPGMGTTFVAADDGQGNRFTRVNSSTPCPYP